MVLTPNQRRSVKRRSVRSVGTLDDGRPAFLRHRNDTQEMAQAILDSYDPDYKLLDVPLLVEWCCHTDDYRYKSGCDDWCERPSSRFVWVGAKV